jgi:two-component system, NtrC family, nitrogen regulation sensor histidine kinase NtrY
MWGIIFNKKALQHFTVAAALVLIAVLIGYYSHHINRNDHYAGHLNNALKQKSLLMESELMELAQHDIDKLFIMALDESFCKQGITFLAYSDGILEYWSNNLISISYDFDSMLFNEKFTRIGNGYYLIKTLEHRHNILVGLLLVKSSYEYENEYLRNVFNPVFGLPAGSRIRMQEGEYDVSDEEGEYLFSVEFPESYPTRESLVVLLFFIYLSALLFMVAGLHQIYRGLNTIYRGRKWVFAFFVADVIILRLALFYFGIPGILYETKLFGPSYLAISSLLPSLGDLIVSAFVLLAVTWYFYKDFRFNFKKETTGIKRIFIGFTLLFHVYIFFYIYQLFFNRIVFDSVISFNLNNIFGLTIQSLYGFLAIAAMLLSFFFVSIRLCTAAIELFPRRKQYLLLLAVTTFVALAVSMIREHFQPVTLLFIFTYILSFIFTIDRKFKIFSFAWVIVYLVAFSLITTYALQTLNTLKEKQQRRLVALELAADRDKIAEYRFSQLEPELYHDEELQSLLIQAYFDPELEYEATGYIIEEYFGRYWTGFDILTTICYPGKELLIRPGDYIAGCQSYFESYIRTLGEATESESLFYIFPGVNYLARFDFYNEAEEFDYPVSVYVEINSKAVKKGLGYPELLLDSESGTRQYAYNYSYATYVNGELVRSVGKFPYSIKDADLPSEPGAFIYFDHNNYSHLLYNAGPDTQLLVSLPKPVFLDVVAPFSYLFIFFGLFALMFSLVTRFPYQQSLSEISFRNRIQYSMFGIVFISFLVVGITTMFYISRLNHNKNIDNLSEKNHSVLIEMEHELAGYDELNEEISDYLDDLLTKFSIVFFSDINVYDPQGWLLASSRPQIFEKGLISGRMNPMAYKQLAYHHRSSFIHQESIGGYQYLSAYLPFRNDQNKLTGYINLPYFARQSELRQEISNFLVAFTNIYVVLMAIGLFLSLLLSDYLIRPLMILKANLRRVKLSESTQKIEWKGKDEISELIGEYNRMTDELVKSAEMLARSERESAWREMAKQVAHEIKNPLTPMKLSVQYLQKAWNENAPDWEERLQRFTKTLIQQIDSLSEIASAFSDFASMPLAAHEKVNLCETLQNAAGLYNDIDNISIQINQPDEAGQCIVLADKRQILRVFNNLIQNSVQAIGNTPEGLIQIDVSRDEDHWQVKIRDNGSGISPEQQEKIFSPYFTTKSSGMGLGLAIVKNIISGIGGTISFQSEEKSGTTFRILLPVYADIE